MPDTQIKIKSLSASVFVSTTLTGAPQLYLMSFMKPIDISTMDVTFEGSRSVPSDLKQYKWAWDSITVKGTYTQDQPDGGTPILVTKRVTWYADETTTNAGPDGIPAWLYAVVAAVTPSEGQPTILPDPENPLEPFAPQGAPAEDEAAE